MGRIHSAEGPYVFDFAAPDPDLADQICDYWVSFAKTGDPNHGDAPEWPAADGDALIDFTERRSGGAEAGPVGPATRRSGGGRRTAVLTGT